MDAKDTASLSMRQPREDIRSGSPSLRSLTRYASPDDVLRRFSKKLNNNAKEGDKSNSNAQQPADSTLDSDSRHSTRSDRDTAGAGSHHIRLELEMMIHKIEESLQSQLTNLRDEMNNSERRELRDCAKCASLERIVEELQAKLINVECLFHKQHALSSSSSAAVVDTKLLDTVHRLEQRILEQERVISNLKQNVDQLMLSRSSTGKSEVPPSSTHHQQLSSTRISNEEATRVHSRPPRSAYSAYNLRPESLDNEDSATSSQNGLEVEDSQFRPPAVHPMITKMNMKRKRLEESRNSGQQVNGFSKHPLDSGNFDLAGSKSSHYSTQSLHRRANSGETGGNANIPTAPRDTVRSSLMFRSGSPQRSYTSSTSTHVGVNLLQRPSSAGSPHSVSTTHMVRSPSSTRRVEWADERNAPPSAYGAAANDRYSKQNGPWTAEQEAELKLRVERILSKTPTTNLDGRAVEDVDYSRTSARSTELPTRTDAWVMKDQKENHDFIRDDGFLSRVGHEKQMENKESWNYESASVPRPYYSKNGVESNNGITEDARRFADQLIAKYIDKRPI